MTTRQRPYQAVSALPRVAEFLSSVPAIRTAQTYRYALGTWAIFLSSTKSKSDQVDTWTDDLIKRFYEWMVRREYQAATIQTNLSATKRYLIWMESNDLLPFRLDKAINRWKAIRGKGHYGVRHADPAVPRIVTYYDGIELPDRDKPHTRLKRLEILRARAVVHTLYASAGRASEITSLTRDLLRDGHLGECRITGKGNKERYLLLTSDAQRAIQAYCAERDDNFPALFISHGRGFGRPIGRGTVWAIVKQAARDLNLKGFSSPHAFRHFRAQQLLDEGMKLETLQAFLGHDDINLTRRVYAPNTSLSKLRQQLNQFGIDASKASLHSSS